MQKPIIILFDLDGTLMDNTEIVAQTYIEGMKELGYSPKSKDFVEGLGGLSTFDTGRALGLKDEELPFIDKYFWEHFGRHAQTIKEPKVFPCVYQFIREAHEEGITLGIVTSNRKYNAEILLEKAQLKGYFSVIVGSDTPVKQKPSGEPIEYALNQLNYSLNQSRKKEVWFVGDSKADVLAGKEANITTISIHSQKHLEEIKRLHPDFMFSGFNEFFEFVFKKICKYETF